MDISLNTPSVLTYLTTGKRRFVTAWGSRTPYSTGDRERGTSENGKAMRLIGCAMREMVLRMAAPAPIAGLVGFEPATVDLVASRFESQALASTEANVCT